MGRKSIIIKFLVLILLTLPLIAVVAFSINQNSVSLTLTAYQDGFVQIDHSIQLSQLDLSTNLTLLGQTCQNLIVLDENNLPIDYDLQGNKAVLYNVGSTKISISYITQDLTSKTGQYWTLAFDYPQTKLVVLPPDVSIISLSGVPDLIKNSDGHMMLTMPEGFTEITYTTEHTDEEQPETVNEPNTFNIAQLLNWQTAAILTLVILFSLLGSGYWLLKRRKKNGITNQVIEEKVNEVDLEKLFSRHRELREDEIQVIKYLASKNGKAFEAELFELLNLPRTTTWRLIKRLEGMEIVNVKKSRRQNIVLIREKYLKKT